MGTYLVRRLFHTVIVVWGALSFLFLLIWLMPGDITTVTGDTGRTQSETITRNLKRLYGLDDSLFVQYLKSLRRIVMFDFGDSATNRDIGEMLSESIGASARLAFWGMVSFVGIGVGIGVLSAARRNGLLDRLSGFTSILLVAMPPFVMGILLQIVFGVIPFQKDWPQWLRFPVQWDQSAMSWFGPIPLGGTWKYLILPVVTIACVNLGTIMRLSRTTMLEVLRADYMRTAAAKGLSRQRVLFRHGLRNAMVPIVTIVGSEVPNVFGFAILTETVWNVPGLGGTIAGAVFSQDGRTVLAFCGVIVLITAVTSLLVDLSYGWLDPRVRFGSARSE